MPKAKAPPTPSREFILTALWILAAAAFWLVPDHKIIRAKLLAVQAVSLLAAARLLWLGRVNKEPGWRASLDASVAAFALSGIIFWALSPERAASEAEAARVFFCALTYWAASRSFALLGAEAFASLWTAGASAAGLWAVLEALDGRMRPFASFGNSIFLGTVLAASLPLALERAAAATPARSLWVLAVAVEAAALLLTNSRAAVFGLLAGLALWALARLERHRQMQALAAIASAAVASLWLFWSREWTHALIWRDALALRRAHPWLGCGLGRFHLEFQAHASPELKARWPEGAVIINFAHNEYLQTLVETGPLGLALLVAVPVAAWLSLRRPGMNSTRGACAAGALTLFACAFVSPDLRFGASAFAAFALLGASTEVVMSMARAPAALTACGLAALAWLAAKPALAVRRNAVEASFHAGADSRRIAALEERMNLAPKDADAAEELGYLKAKASDFTGAAAAFRRAAELLPSRPGPLNNLGNLSYLAGDREGAIAWWTRSLAAAPEQIDARLNLAKLLCELGRLKECAGHLEQVLRREPSNAKAQVLYKKMIE